MPRIYLGVDIGGTTCGICTADEQGRLLGEVTLPTVKGKNGWEDTVRRLIDHASNAACLRAPARREKMREVTLPWSADATARALDAACDELAGRTRETARFRRRKESGERTAQPGS